LDMTIVMMCPHRYFVEKEVSKRCDIPNHSAFLPFHAPLLECLRANICVRFLVFHGGSGSSKDEIREAVVNGVVKMNVDTDTQVRNPYLWKMPPDIAQFAYLAGIRDFVLKKKDYLMSQVGNPEGDDKPNKKQ
jgi:hypothetical protein